jgi:PAS domain S-box-containing protein
MGRINNLVVVVDAHGKVSYVSPSSEKLLGYKPEELLGDGWWNLTVSDERERRTLRNGIQQLAIARKGFHIENGTSLRGRHERKFRTTKGHDKWILWDAVPGPGKTVIGIGQDITERKQAEQELASKNNELKEIHHSMVDSLEYARRIQEMILPEPEKLNRYVHNSFIAYKPRDIVSGDFYWFHRKQDKLYVVAADCTGHGVPGAMMSVLGLSSLRDVVQKFELHEPSFILDHLDVEIVRALSRENGSGLKDGMDIALSVIDLNDLILEFSGAFRGLLHIRNGILTEIPGARFPLGQYSTIKQFTTTCMQLQRGDRLYMFSDGITDQFGGPDTEPRRYGLTGKKFGKARFKELLLSIQDMPMQEQHGFIEYAIANWQQETPQTDDILVIGIEIYIPEKTPQGIRRKRGSAFF